MTVNMCEIIHTFDQIEKNSEINQSKKSHKTHRLKVESAFGDNPALNKIGPRCTP